MYQEMELTAIAQLPGVSDLPSAATRLYFAKALKAEEAGQHVEAGEFLNKAVEAEAKANAPKK